jgi:predicted phage terminase large subunit-like protein
MSTHITIPACGPPRGPAHAPDAHYRVAVAGRSVNDFIEACFTDSRGRPVAQADVHRKLQEHLDRHSRALIELPRDHGKSFQVCCRILWELGKNPDLRVKIVCATDKVAAERSRFLRDTLAQNAAVRKALPDLRASKPWADRGFTVQRDSQSIGPSVAAFGVGAGSTGTRADLLVCDDIVDVRAIHSRAERDRVSDYFTNNLMNLLEPDGRFWGLCTPWHADDLNARLKKNEAYRTFRRAVGPEFEPVWPEKWPAERLRERMAEIGSASFARGYRLVPIAEDETPIRPGWVRFWTEPAEYDAVVLSVDPAVSTSAKADRSALVLLGRTATAAGAVEVRVLACAARRVAAPDLVALIEAFDREHNPALILFESNAAFLGLKDMFVKQAPFGGKVKGVNQSADKGSRVAAFSVAVENGAFRLKGESGAADAGQRELFDEMTTFPFGEHDDLLDAAATGTAHLLDRREPRVW